MATEVKLPRLGQGMESGTVVRWLKQEGERVEKGEPLYELDTEKVTQEVEAEASGVLLKIAVQEGEVPVGQTVAVIGEEGEDVPQPEEPEAEEPEAEEAEVDETPQEEGSRAPERDAEREEGAEASAARDTSEQVTEVREPERNGRVKASPLARRLASRYRGGGEPMDDLVQIASVGLVNALSRFDPERGVRLRGRRRASSTSAMVRKPATAAGSARP
jgi:pyruvate dehydrogenase E2 component (dihydrolipoamide acetyltransferase)